MSETIHFRFSYLAKLITILGSIAILALAIIDSVEVSSDKEITIECLRTCQQSYGGFQLSAEMFEIVDEELSTLRMSHY